MQNSAVLSRANGRSVGAKATGPKKNEAAKGQLNKPPVKRLPVVKRLSIGGADNQNNKNNNNKTGSNKSNSNNNNTGNNNTCNNNKNNNINNKGKLLPSSQNDSLGLDLSLEPDTSATSIISRHSDNATEDIAPKPKTNFTKPRLNQLAEQRINLFRASVADGPNVQPARSPSQAPTPHSKKRYAKSPSEPSMALQLRRNEIVPIPCPLHLEMLQRQLENMQSDFMKKVENFREQGHGYVYKLVTIVHNDNCQILVHNDDMLALPKNMPAQSMNDFRAVYHTAFKESFTFIFEQFSLAQSDARSNESAAVYIELHNKLNGELNNKLLAVDNELMRMLKKASKDDSSKLTHQICELSEANIKLKSINTKLDLDIADIRKNRDDLKRLLDLSHRRTSELSLELANKNTMITCQTSTIEDLRGEIKQMRKSNFSSNKVLQQRIRENESTIESCKQLNEQQLDRIEDLETQLLQAQNDILLLQKKTDEQMQDLAEKEQIIAEQKAQLQELEQSKATWSEPDCIEPGKENICDLQAELKLQQMRLSEQEQAKEMLRTELEQKLSELQKAELKLSRLEEQNEHNRQVLAVRSERINSLDQEMKQREEESNRKIDEIMAQSTDKNTLITQAKAEDRLPIDSSHKIVPCIQISNELASTAEQFQNLRSTLSNKQSTIHSQEQVIKQLEESNARSVKLQTRLGERNAMLKDELDHLRRTVNNLLLGSEVNDADVADILLE